MVKYIIRKLPFGSVLLAVVFVFALFFLLTATYEAAPQEWKEGNLHKREGVLKTAKQITTSSRGKRGNQRAHSYYIILSHKALDTKYKSIRALPRIRVAKDLTVRDESKNGKRVSLENYKDFIGKNVVLYERDSKVIQRLDVEGQKIFDNFEYTWNWKKFAFFSVISLILIYYILVVAWYVFWLNPEESNEFLNYGKIISRTKNKINSFESDGKLYEKNLNTKECTITYSFNHVSHTTSISNQEFEDAKFNYVNSDEFKRKHGIAK